MGSIPSLKCDNRNLESGIQHHPNGRSKVSEAKIAPVSENVR